MVTSGPAYSRSWKIKIIQVRCTDLGKSTFIYQYSCTQEKIWKILTLIKNLNYYNESIQVQKDAYNSIEVLAEWYVRTTLISPPVSSSPIRIILPVSGLNEISAGFGILLVMIMVINPSLLRHSDTLDTNWLHFYALLPLFIAQFGSLQATAANQRTRSFFLNGQGVSTIGTLVGANSCSTDWITIPCATNTGRTTQAGGTVCQDRICGDVFNSEAGQNPSSVYSELWIGRHS